MKCSKCGAQMQPKQKSCSACGNEYIFKLNKGNSSYFSILTAIVAVVTLVIIFVITFTMNRDNYTISKLASEFTSVDKNDFHSDQNEQASEYWEAEVETSPPNVAKAHDLIQNMDVNSNQNEQVSIYKEPKVETPPPSVTEAYEEEEGSGDYEYYAALQEQAENFIIQFRHSYSTALNNDNFSYVESFLAHDSEAYYEISNYMNDISGNQYTFDFIENRVIQLSNQFNGMDVDTYEEFYFIDNAGKSTKYERYKTYTLIQNQSGELSITNIAITDTSKY